MFSTVQAAEHETRLLACAVPALRLLRHCLGRLSDAGAQPPVGPLDGVGALLDFEVRNGRMLAEDHNFARGR